MKKLKVKNKGIMLLLISLYIKCLMFILVGAANGGISFTLKTLIPQVGILGIIASPILFFKERGRLKYIITVDALYSLLLIADLWYYRASGYYLDIKYIFYPALFNPLNNSLFNPSITDILFIVDIIIMIIFYNKLKVTKKRNILGGFLGISISAIIVFGWHYAFDIKQINPSIKFIQNHWESSYNPGTKASYRSPLGNHIYESYLTLKKVTKEKNQNEIKKVDEWLTWNDEGLPNNKYYGLSKGQNMVFLQIEALENFVINQSVYGQEITPNLNKFVNNQGLYFSNIYEQNNGGNSIDADMMLNTGLLTLGDEITFLSYPEVKYNSLPRILRKNGYNSVSTHAERAGDWQWAEAHKAALGFDDMWDINDYNIDEYVGFGLSDRSFYTQYAEKLSSLEEPFYSFIPTLSSHGPFDIKEEYRELSLPKELDSNKLGGYFQSIHYADKQIGLFFELLEKYELSDNTTVVIYGDHGGIHKYYMEDLQEVNMEGDWWQEDKKQVPFIVVGNGIPNERVETIGGHIDIMETMLYLLGVDEDITTMGRNLLNTNRNSTVIKENIVIGDTSEEEEKRLEEAYDIAKYIIINDYFNERYNLD